jgi:hypothetical protein
MLENGSEKFHFFTVVFEELFGVTFVFFGV